MDFIERIFGWAPDNGDGTFELMLFLVPMVLVIALFARRRGWWRPPRK
jgi:hypothetical protein